MLYKVIAISITLTFKGLFLFLNLVVSILTSALERVKRLQVERKYINKASLIFVFKSEWKYISTA